jgi:stage II sporulation protein AB (anti-sigma F factor)
MNKKILNTITLAVPAKSENESLVRGIVAAFAASVDPTIDEINDIKTAVSEAVTNCVVHAYKKQKKAEDKIKIDCVLYAGEIEIKVADQGIGISDIQKAMQPFFTTKQDGERSGMGFAVMQSFMDKVFVNNNERGGTVVIMKKNFTKAKEKKKASGE